MKSPRIHTRSECILEGNDIIYSHLEKFVRFFPFTMKIKVEVPPEITRNYTQRKPEAHVRLVIFFWRRFRVMKRK
jgi:hypothetical protein